VVARVATVRELRTFNELQNKASRYRKVSLVFVSPTQTARNFPDFAPPNYAGNVIHYSRAILKVVRRVAPSEFCLKIRQKEASARCK